MHSVTQFSFLPTNSIQLSVFISLQEKKANLSLHASLSLVLACEHKTLATHSKEQRKNLGATQSCPVFSTDREGVFLMLYVSVTIFF